MVLKLGQFCTPGNIQQRMEAFLIVMTGRTATGLLLIEAWDAAKPPTVHKTAKERFGPKYQWHGV